MPDCILIPLFQQNKYRHDANGVFHLSEIERPVEGDVFLRRNRHRNIGLLPRKMRLSWLWLWNVGYAARSGRHRLAAYSPQFFAILV